MKKIIFSILAISTLFIFNYKVNALNLQKPIGYSHYSHSTVGNNFESEIYDSSNAYGYPNWAMKFSRQNWIYYTQFNDWYGFVFNNLNHDCGNNSTVVLKGTFVTWTNYNPGIFTNSPYIRFVNSNNETFECSIISNQNSNVLDFTCFVENMSTTGSFNIGFSDPGPTNNGTEILDYYSTYLGISKNLDISCQISTSSVINNQNNNTNQIIGSAAQNTTNIINNQIQNKDDILNSQNNNTNQIIGNAAQNTTDIINNQIKNNEELKNTINDNFNNCRESKNLLNMPYLENNKFTYTATKDDDYKSTDFYAYLEAGKQYTFSVETSGTFGGRNDDTEIYLLYDKKYDYIIHMDSKNGYIFTPTRSGNYYIRYDVNKNGDIQSFWNFQIVEGTQNIPFEKFGEQICSNKIDETNQQLEEAEKTRKGILGTLKSVAESIIQLPTKIVTFLIEKLTDLLKFLFIPGDDFLNNWFEDLKRGFEKQLGFLSYPITWILEILNKFLTLNDTGHYIISWSAIKVPNFDFNIIESGSFDLASLLQNSTIKSFHDMYLVIIDALMLLAFMNLCLNVYNRIFGGDVDNYEYISVDEGYNIDVETGEVKSQWTRQRRTRKEKIK